MPSANKTDFLQLNQWEGSDTPKRVDYNEDNLKIDTFAADTAKQNEDKQFLNVRGIRHNG